MIGIMRRSLIKECLREKEIRLQGIDSTAKITQRKVDVKTSNKPFKLAKSKSLAEFKGLYFRLIRFH